MGGSKSGSSNTAHGFEEAPCAQLSQRVAQHTGSLLMSTALGDVRLAEIRLSRRANPGEKLARGLAGIGHMHVFCIYMRIALLWKCACLCFCASSNFLLRETGSWF